MAGGRKLEFDKEKALENAMHVFWEKGFVAASLSDLTESMGINKPSMYATFGNKEALFVQTTQHYIDTMAQPHADILFQDTGSAVERLKSYLLAAVEMQCDQIKPKGCYISISVTEAAGGCLPEKAKASALKANGFAQESLIRFFDSEVSKAEFNSVQSSREKSLFVIAILHGMAALARSGKQPEELSSVVEQGIYSLTH